MTRHGILILLAAPALLAGCGLFQQWHPESADAYRSVFEQAARGDVSAVAAALDREPHLVGAQEEDRLTLLHDAVGESQTAMAAMLLAHGADPNARTGGGLTPLHLAAQNGDIATMELLVAHGGRINAADHQGRTPLDQATSHDHADAVAYLRDHGGRPGRTR